MWPRPEGRGDSCSAPAGGSTLSCFDVAAARGPRRFLLSSSRRFDTFLLSMWPQPEGRGDSCSAPAGGSTLSCFRCGRDPRAAEIPAQLQQAGRHFLASMWPHVSLHIAHCTSFPHVVKRPLYDSIVLSNALLTHAPIFLPCHAARLRVTNVPFPGLCLFRPRVLRFGALAPRRLLLGVFVWTRQAREALFCSMAIRPSGYSMSHHAEGSPLA